MTGVEFWLLGATLLALFAGVSLVIRGRRAELREERASAESMHRMATTLLEIQRELTTSRSSDPTASHDPPTRVRPSNPQHHVDADQVAPNVWSWRAETSMNGVPLIVRLNLNSAKNLHIRLPLRSASEWSPAIPDDSMSKENDPAAVINLWDHLTRESDHGPSYHEVLGSAFDDALIHATRDGVMDPDQAEVLQNWAASTRAIVRPTRRNGKRSSATEVRDIQSGLRNIREIV